MIEAGITGAAVALLNAVRELIKNQKNWQPLALTLAAGFIAVAVSFLAGMDSLDQLRTAFVLGLGGSGVYTIAKQINTN